MTVDMAIRAIEMACPLTNRGPSVVGYSYSTLLEHSLFLFRTVRGPTNGAGIPAELPIVSCRPVATVRLPYRGLLLGSHASGRPTTTYRPIATRKQPK